MNHIYLTGFMGAGKSTLGQKLAARLKVPFVDLDQKIEDVTGYTIPEIFNQLGRQKFRKIERQAIKDLPQQGRRVISLGGGSLQDQDIVRHLKNTGTLVFIEVPIKIIMNRIAGDNNRPLLLDDQGNLKNRKVLKKEMSALYEKRLPDYRQAHITLKVREGQDPDQLVDKLFKKFTDYDTH